MEQHAKNGGVLPAAMALQDALNQQPVTASEPMMRTPLQREWLRQGEGEMDAYLDQSPRLRAFLSRLHSQSSE